MIDNKIKDFIEVDSKTMENLKYVTVKLPQDIKDKLLELFTILTDSINTINTSKCFYSIFYDTGISLESIKSSWNKDKLQEVLLGLSGGNRRILNILFNIIRHINNYHLTATSVDRRFYLIRKLKSNQEYITLTHGDLIVMFLLLLHSMLSVQDINSVFLHEHNGLPSRLGLAEETTIYYTVGYYQDLSLAEKQNIIKYFMCLLIDIKF